MQRPSDTLLRAARALAAGLLIAGGAAGAAFAQDKAAAAAAPAAAAAAMPGIQGQNIMDVKPEASQDPNYLKQSNAERARVQPGNNAPMWRAVGSGVEGYTSLPKADAPEAGVLIQPFVQYPGSRLTTAGEAWRQVRNQWIIPYGAALLAIVVLALGLFYFGKGTIELHGAETGRKIERFTPFERAAHWTNAIAFVALAVSGIVMAFGKFFIQPVIGGTLFGWLTYVLKNVHNFVGPLFVVSLVIVFITFVKDNLPGRGDLQWILRAGGLFGGKEVPSHRFNAGEKGLFWGGVFLLGAIVVASGLVLDKLIPGLIYERATMQVAHMVHAVATVLMMAMFLGHIYMGTLGMRGAYSAMRTGYVDETWAKEHHEYWYDDVKAGKIPAQRSALPGPAAPAGDTRAA
ncbi:formate dehydrogenase subunit gamma [Ramlibacter sp. MAHUQ-53]|uniref:formate dehydrogenase subunit gamma n=1 Tax=unclassified Ramlibacter TaxID=2617605 RepID=UPI0036285207